MSSSETDEQKSQNVNDREKVSEVLPIIKGLLVLAAVVFIAVCGIVALISLLGPGITAFFSSLSSLDSAIVVALITAMVSIISVVLGVFGNNIMKRNEYLRTHREKPYMRLISMFYDFMMQTKTGEQFPEEELATIYNNFTKELTLWGSSKAIKAWGSWRVASSKTLDNPKELLFQMENVLIQLRKDMGLKRGLSKGDLLRLNVNNIDDYIGHNK